MGLNFNISISGLMAAQSGLKTSQMNISNMNTEGYVREVMTLTENDSLSGSGVKGKIGSGVSIANISRVTDAILQNSYNEQNSTVSYYEEIESSLNEVETVMGEYSTGKLSGLLIGFFDAWEEVSKFPEEESYKLALVGETTKLTQKINEMGGELGRIEQNIINSTETQIEEMNTLLIGLAEVNARINELGTKVPNATLNERDRLLEKLSSYTEIEVSYENNHPEVVSIRAGGAFLLDNEKHYDISLIASDKGYYLSNGGTRIPISDGKLKANIDVVDNYLTGYSNSLNKLSSELINQINALHSSGFSLNGDTGLDFFVGVGSKTIAINPDLVLDKTKIATTAVLDVEGNTDIAKGISEIINAVVDNDIDFRNFVNSFSLGMAQDLNNVSSHLKIQSEVLAGLGERKASIEGVSLEEDMTNLMMYQKYFSANSKSITILEEVYDKLLEL